MIRRGVAHIDRGKWRCSDDQAARIRMTGLGPGSSAWLQLLANVWPAGSKCLGSCCLVGTLRGVLDPWLFLAKPWLLESFKK